jgi:hypothetical protein
MIGATESDVKALIAQNDRIQAALCEDGIRAEPVTNTLGESIAIIARHYMDTEEIMSSPKLQTGNNSDLRSLPNVVGNTFPLSGSQVYPEHFLKRLDLIVQAAANRTEGLAEHLMSPSREDSETELWNNAQNFGLHADFLGGERLINEGLLVHGLNIHYTRLGQYTVRLGMLRRLEHEQQLADISKSYIKKQCLAADLRDAYEQYGAPYAEPLTLMAGDLLIFQGRQHRSQGIVAVAHQFMTTSAIRRSDVFRPELGNRTTVQERRHRLAEQFQLQPMGYGYTGQAQAI